jgi:histidinol dehydrogenase
MKIFDYPSSDAESWIRNLTEKRSVDFTEDDEKKVLDIIHDVRKRGNKAVIEYTNRFDAPELRAEDLVVTESEFAEAEKKAGADFIKAIERSVSQVREFHSRQKRNSWIDTPRDGVILGQMVKPVDAAGVYVPGAKGGLTPLVSSVIMGVVPAKIAGVGHIAMVTPPMKDGSINPYLLVAAKMTGADVVYKTGSAWAVAALAYGTETIKKVDVIVGPGNIYVTLAKKLVSGAVGIDMIAGPSEILVIADDHADPSHLAADLLSQSEHDTMASSILVTVSRDIAEKTVSEVMKQLEKLPRKDIARESVDNFASAFIVPDMDTAIDLSNRIAPEHLELQVETPFEMLGKIRNAGAVFMGRYTPEPMGDYIAGPNHVLPTSGTARFASALSVEHFTKRISLINYSRDAFIKEADDVMKLADIEGLEAHANSVRIRLKK